MDRDSIGQALAMSKLNINLAMLASMFDMKPAYYEWDRMHEVPGKTTCRFRDERAYQIEQAGAQPADGVPCRVTVRR